MRIYLYGPDTFRSRRQLRLMIEKFKKERDPQGLNVVRLDGEKDGDQVLQQMLTAPFLAERRMIVIEGLLSSKRKELMEEIVSRIEADSLPESNILIFWEEKDSFRSNAAKELSARLKEEKFSQDFELLSGTKLIRWIGDEVTGRGGRMHPRAGQHIAHHLEGQMWHIDSLIDQLVAYAAGREIQEDDVNVFLEASADDNIFSLVDAIVAKQPKQVFDMIEEQYRQGEDAQYIFAMIIRQFRILLQMRDLFERGEEKPSDHMAKELGLHPFVVKKSLPIMKRYPFDQLRSIHQQLLDADSDIKTGLSSPEMTLDFLVGRLTQA